MCGLVARCVFLVFRFSFWFNFVLFFLFRFIVLLVFFFCFILVFFTFVIHILAALARYSIWILSSVCSLPDILLLLLLLLLWLAFRWPLSVQFWNGGRVQCTLMRLIIPHSFCIGAYSHFNWRFCVFELVVVFFFLLVVVRIQFCSF